MTDSTPAPSTCHLKDLRVAFVGKLGGMSRRDAANLVRDQGGTPLERLRPDVDLIVVGAEELPLAEESLLDEAFRDLAAEGSLEVISETELWQRLGLFGSESETRLYTPAMLAELLDVPVAIIRRWHRRGVIVPVREVRRLPYFDFQEVATARQLAELLAAGASADAVERKLAKLARYVPDVERPLAQLSVIVEGQHLLLRQGEGLIEPGGQLRIDFEALERQAAIEPDEPTEATLPLPCDRTLPHNPATLLAEAADYEDEGKLETACELYRECTGGRRPQCGHLLSVSRTPLSSGRNRGCSRAILHGRRVGRRLRRSARQPRLRIGRTGPAGTGSRSLPRSSGLSRRLSRRSLPPRANTGRTGATARGRTPLARVLAIGPQQPLVG